MFELIYRISNIYNDANTEIMLYRSKDYNSVIDICKKYNIPFKESIYGTNLLDGFWIREMPEMLLNENALNHYLEYHKNTEWKRK